MMMKRTSILVCILLLVFSAAMAETAGNYTYALQPDGTALLTGYRGAESALTLPDVLEGHPVTAIAVHAFAGKPIASVTIPASVTQLKGNPFTMCARLTDVQVAEGHPTLRVTDGVLYDKTTNTLICYPGGFYGDSFTVPQGTAHIGDAAFYCAPMRLEAITIPKTVLTIGDYAFYGANIEKIVLPRSVTSIGDFAFAEGGWDFREVQISSSVASMGRNPFYHSRFLETIKVVKENPNYIQRKDGVIYDKRTRTLVVYPPAATWESYAIPDVIEQLAPYAFSGNEHLRQVTLHPGITSVDDTAFAGTQVPPAP